MTTRHIACVVAAILLCISTTQADTIFVDASCPGGDGSELDPYCSIQTAIDNAVDTDEIVVAPGMYFETINFLGKAVTLRSSDGAAVTTLDAQGNGSVVICESGEGPNTVLSGFVITGGTAFRGGGMFNEVSSPTVIDCMFVANTASFGGGMFNINFSSPTVLGCTFVTNTAINNGGGMLNSNNSDATIVNCRFADNVAGESGGGIYNTAVTFPVMINCTFGNNAASSGGAVFYGFSLSIVRNCIVSGNIPDSFSGPGTPTVTFSAVEGGFSGIGNIDVDPMFVDPLNGDFHLASGSPCIDAGRNSSVPIDITTDLDGNPRFVDDPDTLDTGCGVPPVDMGAYEFQSPFCPGDCGDGDGTVGIVDFLALLDQWGQVGTSCDLGALGVGIEDFLELLANWGPCPLAATVGGCCLTDGSCCTATSVGCNGLGGTYQGDGVSCAAADCGACCFVDGSCLIESNGECLKLGGEFLGRGLSCEPNSCPQPTGACCFCTGSCFEVTEQACNADLGSYAGDFTDCASTPCRGSGACCFGPGQCSVLSAIDCTSQGGVYQGNCTTCNICP